MTRLEVSGCCADENPLERSARGADLCNSDGGSLREGSDRQGVALADCESSGGCCIGSQETIADDSCQADALETTPTRSRSALKVRSSPHASPPQKQAGAQRTAKSKIGAHEEPSKDSPRLMQGAKVKTLRSRGRTRRPRDLPSQSPVRVACRYCKEIGHRKENCPKKDCCFACGQPGHKQADCPARKCSAHANARARVQTSARARPSSPSTPAVEHDLADMSGPRPRGSPSRPGAVHRQARRFPFKRDDGCCAHCGVEDPPELWSREAASANVCVRSSRMQNPYTNVFLCTGCKSSNGKWKKIFAQCQQLHHEVADLAPVRAMPPDEKQACIEDFFLSSARLPDTQPSSPSAEQRLSACRFAVSAAEHYDELSSTQYADMHWHIPTALDEPGFISAREDSDYADGHPAFGTSVCGAPCAVADWPAQDSGECSDTDMDVDFDVGSDAVKPSFDRLNLSSFELGELMRRSNAEFNARAHNAPFNEPTYLWEAAERAHLQVNCCDDPAYAAERLQCYLQPPLYVANEVDRGAPFDTAAEPAVFCVPHSSGASAGVVEHGCGSSADGSAADYDDYGAYYDPQYSAGWQAYSDADGSAGDTCYGNVQSEHNLIASARRRCRCRVACRVALPCT